MRRQGNRSRRSARQAASISAQDLGRDPQKQAIRLTSPGVIYKDLFIVGGRISEGLPASPGDIRAYDVRTGKLRWAFHTIPHPGESGYETWPKDAWTYTGAANNWAGMALDESAGIVFVPTGSAASDFYGAESRRRQSVRQLAARARRRHRRSALAFPGRAARHLGSRLSVAAELVTRQARRPPIDAVAQTTKQGFVFVFDRATGKPLFPIEYREYPASTVAGRSDGRDAAAAHASRRRSRGSCSPRTC